MSRWNRCIIQKGEATERFVNDYFNRTDRKILLIGGGGFDPRSTSLARELAKLKKPTLRGLFIREERPGAVMDLRERADANTSELCRQIPNNSVEEIQIFGDGNAVIGGREIAQLLAKQSFDDISDVVLDISALSTGVYFPAAKMLLEKAEALPRFNLHIFTNEQPNTDHGIVGIACDRATPVHGFWGNLGLDEVGNHARLWLPQLTPRRRQNLERIHSTVAPDDVCPILPFPCSNPRLPDQLVEEFRETLQSWSVDVRNFVYAAEDDPLDLYRTILRLAENRERVFAAAGGSLLTLSPAGSKLLSVGALLAALERNLPVILVESIGYELMGGNGGLQVIGPDRFIHLWLGGDAYAASPKISH